MIFPYDCDSLSPRVHQQFSLPSELHGAQVRYAALQARHEPVGLAPGHSRSLDASDCVLVRQIKDQLLSALPLQVRSYRFTCIAPPPWHTPYPVSLQTLVPTPLSEGQLALHATVSALSPHSEGRSASQG